MEITKETTEEKDEKLYEVFIVDEWDDSELIGFYANLDEASKDVKEWLAGTYESNDFQELAEYPSTFESCVNQLVAVSNSDCLDEESDDVMYVNIKAFIAPKSFWLENIQNAK